MKRFAVLAGIGVGLLLVALGGGNGLADDEAATQPAVTQPAATAEAEGEAASREATTTAPGEQAAPEVPTIEVATADELIAALGPSRTLKLTGDAEYRLDTAQRGTGEYYQWREPNDGQYELVIRNCPGLTLIGPVERQARIVTDLAYATVLSFENCPNLTLRYLEIGHDPTVGYCTGAVVGLINGANIVIDDCALFGCGTEGLTLDTVTALTVSNSVITECAYGILTAADCDGLTFTNCRFSGNQEYYGLALTDTVNVHLTDCVVTGNVVGQYGQALFTTNLTVDAARIIVTGGRIEGNTAPQLCQPPGMLVQEDAVVANNTWQP